MESSKQKTGRTPGSKQVNQAELQKIVSLRNKGMNVNQIGAIVKRNPATIYKRLVKLGIDTKEFKALKDNWSDIQLAESAKIADFRSKVLDSVTDKDIKNATFSQKTSAVYQSSLAIGATIDQAPKVQVNIQYNIHAEQERLNQIEQELRLLRGEDTNIVTDTPDTGVEGRDSSDE